MVAMVSRSAQDIRRRRLRISLFVLGFVVIPNLVLVAGIAVVLRWARSPSTLVDACFAGDDYTAGAALTLGANPNVRGGGEATPLHWAARLPDTVLLDDLLEHGADPNAQDEKGRSPLHWAIATGTPRSVRALLRGGADPDLPNSRGATPADYARSRGGEMLEAMDDAARATPSP